MSDEAIPDDARRLAARLVEAIPNGTQVNTVDFMVEFAARAILAERARVRQQQENDREA